MFDIYLYKCSSVFENSYRTSMYNIFNEIFELTTFLRSYTCAVVSDEAFLAMASFIKARN